MTVQIVRDIAAEAFADAIDMLSIIETLEAGNTPAAVAAVNARGTDQLISFSMASVAVLLCAPPWLAEI